MKKGIFLAILFAAVALLTFTACEETVKTETVTDLQPYDVGDILPGSWTVTVADDLGGYIAERLVDADPEDDLDFGADASDEVEIMVTGKFGSDITFTKSHAVYATLQQTYYLSSQVIIGNDNANNAVLTIEAGTLIKGEVSSVDPGVLIVSRGSKIQAVGTATDPIVFTSANEVGDRAQGDWGGIVLLGNGISNEGPDAVAEAIYQPWGGSDNTDSSGTLQYVRVEFAGTLFDSENELNGIAFYGIGSGTTVDHVQVHMNGDDGVEFFGGAVKVSYLVLTGEGDDSLDYDNGWVGGAQFVIIQQYAGVAGDKLIEGDGEADPTSTPYLANMTIMTPRDEHLSIKVNSEGEIVNTVIVSSLASPELVDDHLADGETTVDAGVFAYDGVIVEGYDTADADADGLSDAAPIFDALIKAAGNVAVVEQTNYDSTNQYAIDNAIFTILPGTVTAVDATAYGAPAAGQFIGAYDGTTNWWTGWTTEAAN